MKQKELFFERHAGGERAVIVHNIFSTSRGKDSLTEFIELSRSAGVEILDVIIGKRDTPDAKYFIGKGKAEEVQMSVLLHRAEVVIFNHVLTPAQGRNLEKLFECRVLDRPELILDIFAQRARSFEGKLQVELAQLQHLSSRLVRGWTHLERQKGGIGLRGPGETQLETDRRLIANRIKSIKKKLEKVVSQREQGRKSRQKAAVPTVSLVGYTNAGKSTLFNRLTDAHVYEADQLFATLDPTLRQIKLPVAGPAIIADTVGFIHDLPPDLIAAFRATLEETIQADLLLHVIDSHNEERDRLIDDVEKVLTDIGANEVPQIQVQNKIDLLSHVEPRIDRDEQGIPYRVWLSARSGEGIDLLHTAIGERLAKQIIRCQLVLTQQQGKLRAQLYEMGVVMNEFMNEREEIVLDLTIPRREYEKLLKKIE